MKALFGTMNPCIHSSPHILQSGSRGANRNSRFLSHKLSFQENFCIFYCEYTASLLMVCDAHPNQVVQNCLIFDDSSVAPWGFSGERETEQQCVLLTVCSYKYLSLLACYTPRCRLTADWAVTLFIMSPAVKALTLSFKRCCQKRSSPAVHSERGALQLLRENCRRDVSVTARWSLGLHRVGIRTELLLLYMHKDGVMFNQKSSEEHQMILAHFWRVYLLYTYPLVGSWSHYWWVDRWRARQIDRQKDRQTDG